MRQLQEGQQIGMRGICHYRGGSELTAVIQDCGTPGTEGRWQTTEEVRTRRQAKAWNRLGPTYQN